MKVAVVQLGREVFHEPDGMDFNTVSMTIGKGAGKLRALRISEIVGLLDNLGAVLLKSEVRDLEGMMFLARWLRTSNLERILSLSFRDTGVLSGFSREGGKYIRAQPRGNVSHWIAGNVPTLGFFSLFQSLLVGNSNVLRVPMESVDAASKILGIMKDTPSGDLMDSFSVVTFPSSDVSSNEHLSMIADARVVWGGKEAVESITGLPRKPHCEDVVFGPKYSFSVIDSRALESENLDRILRRLVNDILIFDQSACSSPHVLFFERTMAPEDLLERLAREFRNAVKKKPKTSVDTSTASKIITKRAEYALDTERDVRASRANDWTILFDEKFQLEEPVQSRTLFVKPVASVLDVADLITSRIQTLGCAVHDEDKLFRLAEEATRRGVARCVPFGRMHFYETPWDGIMILSRLVRWCSLSVGK